METSALPFCYGWIYGGLFRMDIKMFANFPGDFKNPCYNLRSRCLAVYHSNV